MVCSLYSPNSLTGRGIASIRLSSKLFSYMIPSLFPVGGAGLEFTAHIEGPQPFYFIP
jgi:hypothetical protein